MNKTQISLHLATKMGLPNPRISQFGGEVECGTSDSRNFDSGIGGFGMLSGTVFDPFETKSQWADVILWAWANGHTVAILGTRVSCSADTLTNIPVKPESRDSLKIASLLKAIAVSTGYQE